jgi:hypothetical protein
MVPNTRAHFTNEQRRLLESGEMTATIEFVHQ